MDATHNYVIGDNDGSEKIFDNKITEYPANYTTITTYNGFDICVVSDIAIRSVLGFRHDCDRDGIVVIGEPGSYRVQGEVLLQVDYCEDPMQFIRDTIIRNSENYYRQIILDQLYGILLELGYTPRFRNNMIIIPLWILSYLKMRNILPIFVDQLRGALMRYGYESKILDQGHLYCVLQLTINNDAYNIRITANDNTNFGDVVIEVLFADCDNTELEREIKTITVPPQEFTIWLGNHRIKFRGWSLTFSYTPRRQPIFLPTVTINANENVYIIKDDTIEFTHLQHMTKRVAIRGAKLIRFETTETDARFTAERNRIILSMAKKESKIN